MNAKIRLTGEVLPLGKVIKGKRSEVKGLLKVKGKRRKEKGLSLPAGLLHHLAATVLILLGLLYLLLQLAPFVPLIHSFLLGLQLA